ncbi:hypothetical protein MRX96_019713 [Rhipicephalus microplus]
MQGLSLYNACHFEDLARNLKYKMRMANCPTMANADADHIIRGFVLSHVWDKAATEAKATTFGKLPEFCTGSGNIKVYLESFELFAKANGMDALKELEVFLTINGEKAYVALRTYCYRKQMRYNITTH